MRTYPREQKFDEEGQPRPGQFFYGNFGQDIPFSISYATLAADFEGEKAHYHQKVQKVYVTLEGEGILMVGQREVTMSPEQAIHIGPGEIHYVAKVLKAPLVFMVITNEKKDDKVVLENYP